MNLRTAVTAGLSLGVLAGCGRAAPPTLPAPPPAPVSAPAPAPSPVVPSPPAEVAPNRAPTISGPAECISPLDADHIFDLELADRDGDPIRWTAEKQEASGTLHQAGGGPVPSGTTVTLVYSPPSGRRDENWITVTATDGRGGRTVKRLYVKNS